MGLYPDSIPSSGHTIFSTSKGSTTYKKTATFEWSKRPLLTALLLVVIWSGWRLAVLDRTGLPAPRHVDEFSYLLGADTFARGRLANPSHPLSRFFDSPHILVQPAYASKYPPGQAMFLALGERLGSPFYGVLLGNALMLFTICLMLFAWVPPRWALAVSVTMCLCLRPSMYWTDSYWGGSVAASGGALVLLGIAIYRKEQSLLAGAVFAIGVLLLFWTRPYEGGVFTLAVLIVFGKELWRLRHAGAMLTAAALLAVGFAWTCYDDEAVTGNPFRLPYIEHVAQYNYAPELWILSTEPLPAYSNARLLAYWGPSGSEAAMYFSYKPWWRGMVQGLGLAVTSLRLWPALFLIVLFPFGRRKRLFRKMAFVVGLCLFALSLELFHFEHYSAPAWAAVALLIAVWAGDAWNFRFHNLPAGKVLVLLALASPVIDALVMPRVAKRVEKFHSPASLGPQHWGNQREALIRRLSALDRRQLVIVRYPSPGWNIFEEWVYNDADIDQQRVVFAHDLGARENRALLGYYPDRGAWLLTFDPATEREHLEPYLSEAAQP